MDAPMRVLGKRVEREPFTVEVSPAPHILRLPNEMLDHIFSYIPEGERVISARVCKFFCALLPKDQKVTRAVALAAARHGSINLYQWFSGEVAPMLAAGKIDIGSIGVEIHREAASFGRLQFLQWFRANGGTGWGEETCRIAVETDHFPLFQWLISEGCPFEKVRIWRGAIRLGRLEVLRCMKETPGRWNEYMDIYFCEDAAKWGHLPLLQWARATGISWNVMTCANAAWGGHLSVLQWAKENGCPWDDGTCTGAAVSGKLAVLQWAITNGAPYNYDELARATMGKPIHRWVVENRFLLNGTHLTRLK